MASGRKFLELILSGRQNAICFGLQPQVGVKFADAG